MARPLRIEYAGALYHVTSRGDRREAIYLDDGDRLYWLALLGKICARQNWRCYAYCLMDNHYHVLIETVDGRLSEGMRQLNGVCTQWHNRAHDQVGHLFQGRFKAILVQRDAYLLELARYVVLNPVRAGLVARPEDWPWSSYRAMLSGSAPPWLHAKWLLSQFGGGHYAAKTCQTAKAADAAKADYADYVSAGAGAPSIWDELQGQVVLGDSEFAGMLSTLLSTSKSKQGETTREQRRAAAQPLAHFRAMPARDFAIAQA